MIERQLYREFIEEQGFIESGTAEQWGYKINAEQYIPAKKRLVHNIKVSKIDPIKHVQSLPRSKALLKIDEDLLMLQNEKKLNELTEKAKEAADKGQDGADMQSAAIKMMNQCFQQYNFLLEHRHIIEKNSERARKMLGIKKTKLELITEQIAHLRDKIGRSSFSEVIDINKKIAQLYRQYEKNINLAKEPTEKTRSLMIPSPHRARTQVSGITNLSNFNSSKFSPRKFTQNKSSSNQSQHAKSGKRKDKLVQVKDFTIMQQLKESQSGDDTCTLKKSLDMRQNPAPSLRLIQPTQPQSLFLGRKFMKLKKKNTDQEGRKRLYTVKEKTQKRQKPKVKMSETLAQNFVSKEWMNKGSALDKEVQFIEDVIDVWKHRVDSNRQKNLKNLHKFMTPKKESRKKAIKDSQASDQEIKNNERLQKAKRMLKYQMEELKQDLAGKEKILSLMIKKRQSRFTKVPGTQLLKINNPCQAAKVYLGTAERRNSEMRDARRSSCYSFQQQQKYVLTEGPQWLNIQEDSEDLYWSTLRNQKINLLLKNSEKR